MQNINLKTKLFVSDFQALFIFVLHDEKAFQNFDKLIKQIISMRIFLLQALSFYNFFQ